MSGSEHDRGVIAFFARNPVAANLLMVLLMVWGGITLLTNTRSEVFPASELSLITVSVLYPGATPAEVEEGICQRIEEEVQGIAGVERVQSTAVEGVGTVTIQVLEGEDIDQAFDEVKNRVGAIDSFPEEAETPIVNRVSLIRQVINLAISGEADERTLKTIGERVRDDLLATGRITKAELSSVRPYEISIEVAEAALRRHGLSFAQVADAVRRASLDLPGGSVKTSAGEILLRARHQAYRGPEFEELVLLTRPDGSRLRLGEVARVVDGFADTDVASSFDGKPAVLVQVFRVGEQSAFEVADTVYDYIEGSAARVPPGITITAWRDDTAILRSRLDLLLRNGLSGLCLVFLSLALFLRFKLALWVTWGIPVSFLATFAVMPMADITLNMISLFAFIVVLGIVVDDAIVVSENVYSHIQRGVPGQQAAVRGTKQVAIPVIFSVLTTMVAFVPMLDVAGNFRRVWQTIPFIVIATLFFSLLESQLVLPSHLSHVHPVDPARQHVFARLWSWVQWPFLRSLELFVRHVHRPVLGLAVRWRYLTLATFAAVLAVTVGFVLSGKLPFRFLPELEGDNAIALLRMPQGTAPEVTRTAVARIEAAALELRSELAAEGQPGVIRHVLASVGSQPFALEQRRNTGAVDAAIDGAHLGEVNIQLAPSEERTISAEGVARRWRAKVGTIADAVELTYSTAMLSAGEDIDVRLTSPDFTARQAAAAELQAALAGFAGVTDIADSLRIGKREVELRVTPEAETLGLSAEAVARQVRQGFHGEEAQRIQRGREDVKVMVRYPAEERRSLGDLEDMRLRTPAGDEIPFARAVRAVEGRGYAVIQRTDRARKVNVTARVDPLQGDVGAIVQSLSTEVLPRLAAAHPGLHWAYEGQAEEQGKVLASLGRGYLVALFGIFTLIAIPFRSYVQPLIVMTAIPFGLVGAIWGHIVFGAGLSIMSMFGLVALTGVVVNDSIVLVDFVNNARRRGVDLLTAVMEAGQQRFRPILLTSLTTFAGLLPLMFETSMQAKFLIPMAISLACGVMFSTVISLILVPALYIVLEDLRRLLGPVRRGWRWLFGGAE